jgi:hypothetical protein
MAGRDLLIPGDDDNVSIKYFSGGSEWDAVNKMAPGTEAQELLLNGLAQEQVLCVAEDETLPPQQHSPNERLTI